MKNQFGRAAALGLIVALLAVAGCGSSDSDQASGSGEDPSTATNGAEGVLAQVKSSGVLEVAGSANVPPYLFTDASGKVTGIEADMIKALADEMGVQAKITNITFAGLIPALQSGRADIAMSDFSDTAEREQQVDFIDYTLSGQAFLVPSGNPAKITDIADFCGARISAPKGTLSAEIPKAQSKRCVAAGKPAVKTLEFPSASDAQLQIQNRRADAMAIDYTIASWQAQQSNGKMKVVGDPICPNLHGAAILKDQPKLEKAIIDAFKRMMDSGKYQQILKKWHVEKLGMKQVVVNGATDPDFKQAKPSKELEGICP